MPYTIDDLQELMARLRDPEQGCPWDRKQTFRTIAPYTVEEAYEVADAIERDDLVELKEELGDLLFQVVFHSRMAEEAGEFEFAEVVDGIVRKMRRRHPHVFGEAEVRSAGEQSNAWETQKERERQAKRGKKQASVLDGVALALPSMTRAEKLQKRAARAGFDWPEVDGVIAKIEEELEEVSEEMAGEEPETLAGEIGDLLFACINLARHVGVDPEPALRRTNTKFERRFQYVEQKLREQGVLLEESDLDQMDRLWEEAKRLEKRNKALPGSEE